MHKAAKGCTNCYNSAPSAPMMMYLLPLCVLSSGYDNTPLTTMMVPTSCYVHMFTARKNLRGRDNIVPFLFSKSFLQRECCKGGKSRSGTPCPPPNCSRMPGSSGCSLNLGWKVQCDALWDLQKIITNIQNY